MKQEEYMSQDRLRAILFSGGAGSRLWPLSRRARPKQFQPLVGKDSLFQLMVRRLERNLGIANIYISTGEIYRDVVLEQVPNLPPENVIAEPEMRDTLAAVGYAVALLNHRSPGATIATLWGADHVIRRDDEFLACLQDAYTLAREQNWVVKIDVRPSFPSDALGYIEYGAQRAEVHGRPVYSFVRQVEKPPTEMAQQLIEAGTYLWNTGYIVWTADKVLSLYEQHAPEAYHALRAIVTAIEHDEGADRIAQLYHSIPKMSVDKGVFEKMSGEDMVVMPADLGWGDIGAWDVLRNELREVTSGNVVHGTHLAVDTSDTLIYGPPEKLVVTIGVHDLIVVDTGDALLICPADRSQEVKQIVQQLEKDNPDLL
jgi:mannose-1-phosphate guanylyltransferase